MFLLVVNLHYFAPVWNLTCGTLMPWHTKVFGAPHTSNGLLTELCTSQLCIPESLEHKYNIFWCNSISANWIYFLCCSLVKKVFWILETPGTFRSYWHFFYETDFQWQQFGHFLSVNGCTKGSKRTASTGMTTGKHY